VWAHRNKDGSEPHSFHQHQTLLNSSLPASFKRDGKDGGDVHLFHLPADIADDKARGSAGCGSACIDFSHRVMSLPKKVSLPVPVQSQHGVASGMRQPSEKEWLRNAISLFSAIRTFSFLNDYLTVLQSSGTF
jgi:hypothetical protein